MFHETISSSLTMIYGRSNVGKSYLVTSMLLSLLVKELEFLELKPTDPAKLWKPAILWTDPGSDEEYAERIYPHLPDADDDVEIPMFWLGRTTRTDEWTTLTDALLSAGINFVVLDNLMGATGDTNQPGDTTTVLDGLTRLVSRGVPVVVIHHESEHGYSAPGAPAMGVSVSTQKARAWIQVRQTNRRGLRGGNTALIIRANALDQARHVVAEPTSPNYRIIRNEAWDDDKQQPSPGNGNMEIARWVVENCQGIGFSKVAPLLAEKFTSRNEGGWRGQLSRSLGGVLIREGEGDNTSWRLA